MDALPSWPLTGPTASLPPGTALLRRLPRLSGRRAVALVAAFLGLCLVLWSLFGLPLCLLTAAVALALPLSIDALSSCEVITAPAGVATVAGSLLGTLVAVRLLRRRGGPSLGAMGLRRQGSWIREIVLGAALGPIAFALVLALELACGWVVVAPGRIDAAGLLLAAIAFTGVAVSEEIATRGFLLQVLGSAWSPSAALVGSSLLFAILHSLNPNVSGVAIGFLVVAGLTLAWGYFATGRLWLPIAFHWSWNFAQGPLFGFPVSGLPVDGVLSVTPTGPDWATGGAFGPEAGLVGLAAEAVVAALIYGWWRARGNARATLATAGGGLLGLLILVLVSR
jgi:membrane protease YdiL (CAAX protease family)